MSYSIKPSIGMMPTKDLDIVMQEQGFIKSVKAKDIEEVTSIKDNVTGEITTPGIQDATQIALCAGEKNTNGTLDRTTVKNSLNFNGKPATEYLSVDDKKIMDTIINALNKTHSNEIQLLRDELYQMKEELVKTGHIEDLNVASGFIDGFKNSNLKYDNRKINIESINGATISTGDKDFSGQDWLVVRRSKSNEVENTLATVNKEKGSSIELNVGTGNLIEDESILLKSLGEYNTGTYSFSTMKYNTPNVKESYTMLNDDSNITRAKVKADFTGLATVLKVPSRCSGFLTKFTVQGRKIGNPGALTCYLVKGDAEYINSISNSNGLSKIRLDNNLIATSMPLYNTDSNSSDLVFDFTNTDYNPDVQMDTSNTLYPIVAGAEYCFILTCDEASEYDYWEVELGHKKSVNGDLQTNNNTFQFFNKDLLKSASSSFTEIENADMLYCVTTRTIDERKEIPYSVGLYTMKQAVKLSAPIKASRARLTLQVNKEGNFITVNEGVANANVDTIEFKQLDGNIPNQCIINGGDKVIIGDKVATVRNSTLNTITTDSTMYITPNTNVYRCGYKAKLKVKLYSDSNESHTPTLKEGTEKIFDLKLVAVIPSGRRVESNVSDRLIFEVDFDDISKDADNQTIYFNDAELQIQWESNLSASTIREKLEKSIDYVGRIHALSLAFDKTI